MPATMHYKHPKSLTKTKKPPVKEVVANILEEYFETVRNEKPAHVYNLVLTEIELPLMQAVLRFTDNNQSEAAKILGLNRGTFRKKLAFYSLL